MNIAQNFAFTIENETPADAARVENLIAEIFGPGMFARAAHQLRGKTPHEPQLSFVARSGGELVGSVRLTRFLIGSSEALLLGPLGVSTRHKSCGIGRALMQAAIKAAGDHFEQNGLKLVFLVGDLAYYKPFGFKQAKHEEIILPRPADPARMLVCELSEGAAKTHTGVARALIE